MRLSIGMMVKNEEKYLEQCLSSLMPILDKVDSELIIVDTGSNDKTVEIAKKFTDKVYFHKWNNNFAEMRNITINYCCGEWFLCIDGDEVVEDCNEIINFFNSREYKKYKSATFNIKNFTDLTGENSYNISPSLRMFEKDKEFKYIGAIHNQPVFKRPVKEMNICVKHYGYISTDKELMEKKFKRTSEMLKEELKKDPGNIYYMFQLSVTYSMHGDIEEAMKLIKETYNYIQENKIDISKHIYVYQQLCMCYLNTNNYFQLIKYASEWLTYQKNIIDAHYYLGYSYFRLSRREEAIVFFEKYVEMIESNTYHIDTRIVNHTIGNISFAYYSLNLLYRKINEVEKAIFYLMKIKSNEFNISREIAELCIKNKYYEKLYEYYNNLMETEDNNRISNLFLYIESEKLNLDKNECHKIVNLFSEGNSLYAKLNKIRIKYWNGDNAFINDIKNLIDEEGIVNLPDYYGDLVYYLINAKEDISEDLNEVGYKVLNNYLKYITTKYDDFGKKTYEYLEEYGEREDFNSLKINKELFRYIILLGKLGDEKSQQIFLKYIDIGIRYINMVYSPFILDNERYHECRTEEEGFFIFMRIAKKYEKFDKKLYLRYLSKALEIYPNMKEGIKLLLDKVKEVSNIQNNEMEQYKLQVKNTIKLLIDSGKIKDAEKVINEYEEIVKDDVEIYSSKAIIFILQNKFIDAEEILKSGLEVERHNFDLNYNLAYLYHMKDDIEKSLNFYKNAYNYTGNITIKDEIKSAVEDIIIKNKLDININDFLYKRNKKKCLVLCHFFSVYTKNFLERLKKAYDIEFDILTMDKDYKEKIDKNIIENVFVYKNIDELVNKINLIEKYDIIHIHFLAPFYGLIANQIRTKCDKLIVTIWGSDYYRTSQEEKQIQKNIFQIADNINFGNENTLVDFDNFCNKAYSDKLSICRFGLIQLDYIKASRNVEKIELKKLLGLPKDSIIITCGYNASPAQNHMSIIDSILKIRNQLPANCYFLFPMTYGDKNLVFSVRERLKECGINHKIYDEFLSEEDTAILRLVSDIMIQVQTTDQLSGSMQEYLYADNLVITGSWLPYSVFKNKGIYFIEVDRVQDVGDKLVHSVRNLHKLKNKCSQNKEVIWNMTSWEKAINNWINVYENEI
jgi:glycosyltransferase involved in cell wall biosynthesis